MAETLTLLDQYKIMETSRVQEFDHKVFGPIRQTWVISDSGVPTSDRYHIEREHRHLSTGRVDYFPEFLFLTAGRVREIFAECYAEERGAA